MFIKKAFLLNSLKNDICLQCIVSCFYSNKIILDLKKQQLKNRMNSTICQFVCAIC